MVKGTSYSGTSVKRKGGTHITSKREFPKGELRGKDTSLCKKTSSINNSAGR